jgi:flagellar protein FliO/FliZ
MSDLLEPLLGAGGARIAQFVITVVVVLGLIAAAYWAVRRYGGFRIGGIGRGRVPRLAIVDAVAIDNRRRLVLVRRDNVEHLLMIGGPSDVVVEPGIVRRRRPPESAARPQPQAAAGTPAPVRPPAEAAPNPPIPFPAPRPAPAPAPEPPGFRPFRRAGTAPPDIVVNEGRPATTARPVDRQPPAVGAAPAAAEPQSVEPFLPEVVHPQAETSPPATTRAPEPAAAEPSPHPDQTALDLGDTQAGAASRGDEPTQANGDGDTAAKVSHLEQEMVKLLDEIAAPRSSS